MTEPSPILDAIRQAGAVPVTSLSLDEIEALASREDTVLGKIVRRMVDRPSGSNEGVSAFSSAT